MDDHLVLLEGLVQREETTLREGLGAAKQEDVQIFMAERSGDGGVKGGHGFEGVLGSASILAHTFSATSFAEKSGHLRPKATTQDEWNRGKKKTRKKL
jgi:hypothetical protein